MHLWRIFCIVGLLAGTAVASPFTITDLGTLGGPGAVAYKVNEMGQVSVDSRTTGNLSWQPFLWDDGTKTPAVPLPAGGKSYAFGLNDLGVQVGRQFSSSLSLAVMWTAGVPTELPGLASNQALGVNNAGIVVGSSGADVWTEGPVYWDSTGRHTLPVLAGGLGGAAWDINDAGWMAGWSESASSWWQAVLWMPDGSIVEIPGPEAADGLFYALNEDAEAVGSSYAGPVGMPIHWDGTSVVTLPVPVGMGGSATGISDEGVIVGYVYDTATWEWSGVYWDATGMHDVNTPELAAMGWHIEGLWGVNSDGWMVGEGIFGGQSRAILLTPIPESSTIWLVLGGVVLLVRRRRS